MILAKKEQSVNCDENRRVFFMILCSVPVPYASARVDVTGEFGEVFDHDVIVVDFHFALIHEAVKFVFDFGDGEAGPAGDFVEGCGKVAEVGGAFEVRLGFVEHEEYVADAGHLVRDGEYHEAAFLGIDTLDESFQQFHGDDGVSHHQYFKIGLVEFEGL